MTSQGLLAHTAPSEALRVFALGAPGGALSLEGAISITTVNATGQSFPTSPAQTGIVRESGGDTFHFGESRLEGSRLTDQLDVFISGIPGHPPPMSRVTGSSLQFGIASTQSVSEVAYVDSTRAVATVDVEATVATSTSNFSALLLEGSFAVSLWGVDLQVRSGAETAWFETGVHRRNEVRDPITGVVLTWEQYEQVAQVTVQDGWLAISAASGLQLSSWQDALRIAGQGEFSAAGVTGTIEGKGPISLEGQSLQGTGQFDAELMGGNKMQFSLSDFAGSLYIDGGIVDLPGDGPVRSGSVAAQSTPWRWTVISPMLAIIGLMLVAVAVKGPAMSAGFRRVEARFEEKQYAAVLARIEPFTHRRRFERRATFLKIVSLLSLGEFKEAQLYLHSLGPRESPAPSTKSFLHACAAAGLGQEAEAIRHLTACLEQDPSYIEEVRAVPILAVPLGYVTISGGSAQ